MNRFGQGTTIEDVMGFIRTNHLHASNSTVCWRDTYGRGVGVPISSCPSSTEKDGALCYPLCESGYTGVGPVCWQNCQVGFTDEGALCSMDGSITSANNSACPWYDKCGLVEAVGCSVCPDPAPGQTIHNDGCTCRIDPIIYAKKSYGRGAGTSLICKSSEQYDAGLCYEYCKSNYQGVGPVCWEFCPTSRPNEEGALCCATKADCDQKIDELAKSVLAAVEEAILAGADLATVVAAIKAAIEAAIGFILPLCGDFP